MSLDEVEDFEIPAEVPGRTRISLTSSIFAYPGPRKIFGEIHGAHMQALPAAYSRAQVHHRHRGRSAARGNPGITFLPQPSRAVPFSSFRRHIGHDFSKRLTSSQCVICLSSDTKPGETRARVRCVCVSTFSRCHILMHISGIAAKRMRKRRKGGERERETKIYKVTFYLRIF